MTYHLEIIIVHIWTLFKKHKVGAMTYVVCVDLEVIGALSS